MINVALHNLGCKVNSYEMDVMQQKLEEKGYGIVPFDCVADVYIINTCTVTNIADRKSRQMLHRAKALNPQAVVVAVGCYVQVGGEEALKDGCIDLAIGNNRKKDLVEILEAYLAQRGVRTSAPGTSAPAAESSLERKTLGHASILEIGADCEYEEMPLRQAPGHTRAYIKVQDGCNQFCSYCIIPYARGRVRSRRLDDVLEEVRGIVAAGCQEVVLTGIHLSSYGIDLDDETWERIPASYNHRPKLIDLVEAVDAVEGVRRIRLGSLEPRIITPENVKRLSAAKKLCPHFHLSLQSGCDETLKRMNRRYTSGEYYQCVELLREAFDHPAITTDVIVGFPGETEEEFKETCAFLKKVRFYEMHIFKYSLRKGTRAASMPGQVPDPVKAARSNLLFTLEKEQSRAFRGKYIGKEAEVLFEEEKVLDGRRFQVGHTRDYVAVALNVGENLSNCRKMVKIVGFLTDEIMISQSLN